MKMMLRARALGAHASSVLSGGGTCTQDARAPRVGARVLGGALQPFLERAVYVNSLEDALEEGDRRVREAYGPNDDRLVGLKNKYDPTNLLHLNSNIKRVRLVMLESVLLHLNQPLAHDIYLVFDSRIYLQLLHPENPQSSDIVMPSRHLKRGGFELLIGDPISAPQPNQVMHMSDAARVRIVNDAD